MSDAAPEKPLRGILLMVGAVTVFTVMSAFIKAADRVPAGQAMFFRSVFALPFVLSFLAARGELRTGVQVRRLKAHLVRGLAGACAMGLGFAGLRYLPLPDVTAIRFVTPVMMVILAALILGERVRLIRISAVAVGLLGVLIIVWPRLTLGSESDLLGVAMILASAFLAAFAQIMVKAMSGTETTASIVFWFSVIATLASLLTIPFGWVWPTPQEAALLIGAGVIGGAGQMMLTSSYRFADAGVLAPFTYVSMLWSIVIGLVWFDEVPTAWTLLGAALVIGAGVAIVLRERALGIEATARRKVRAKAWQ